MLQGTDFRVFKIIDISTRSALPIQAMLKLCESLGLMTVPILAQNYHLPENMVDLLSFADGFSQLNEKREREGVVLISEDDTSVHFKAISNKYLEKYE